LRSFLKAELPEKCYDQTFLGEIDMGLIFRKENQVEVFGLGGEVVITETDEFDEQFIVTMSIRQFEEIVNRSKHLIAEAMEEEDGLD
jgi:hypothetical protein